MPPTLIQIPTTGRLERDLRSALKGEVQFDAGARGMYASDAGNYRMIPIGVVRPADVDDVLSAVSICREHGAPIVARGGGTGIPGQTVNAAVVFDFSRHMTRLIQLNPERRYARVQPGIVLDELRNAAQQFGLTFGPDPATHSRNTLGGMIGNNSCGIHSMMAGETVDNIEELEIVLYDGTHLTVGATTDDALQQIVAAGGRRAEIYLRLRALRDRYAAEIRRRFPSIPRRVSGFNLPALLPEQGFHVARALVGTECTCALVVEAKTTLVENPAVRTLVVFGFPDIFAAADRVVEIGSCSPIGLEALDDTFFEYMKKKGLHPPNLSLMPEGHAWLLAEFGGHDKREADEKARRCIGRLSQSGGNRIPVKLFDDPTEEHLVWWLREEGLGATAKVPGMPENHEGWEDASVPPAQLGVYLREFKQLIDRYGYEGPLYGHFGQGCVHTRLTFDLDTADGIRTWRRFLTEAADLVVRHGGSLSGEHGDGQARGELLPRMYGAEIMEAFREFKAIWDPDGKMNPGKVVDAYAVDEHLREGPDYNLPQVRTHFHFPADRHSFAVATDRCVGAGVCRRHDGDGVMCPSYMVTREEKHSTRGRARLLNEMIRSDVVTGGWRDESVREALDLCLSCKGCKHDCPVQVDMATYKAEFLAHYYEGRVRPRYAYASGLIYWWARAAAIMPATANFLTQTPGLSHLAKLVGGYSQKRSIPAFAPETFKTWFAKRGVRNSGKPPVILWPDTFNNHFTPPVARAAVEVLEDAGYQVRIPARSLCCGRPLYDYGMLGSAKHLLRQTIDVLREPIRRGIPIVGLEPSCVSVFRDELGNLLYGDEDAVRLAKQTHLLSEFLHDRGYTPPQLHRSALVHGHCHHKSELHFDGEVALLKSAGLECDVPESGCCGMAGSFGYEADHYETGLACGERVLLPAVRRAPRETLVVADGFSCREMIQQETNRRALHVAQVLQMALHEGPDGARDSWPETRYAAVERTPALPASVVIAGIAAIAGIWFATRNA